MGSPAWFISLPAARDGQSIRGHIVGDRGARRDVGAVADSHRGDQRGIRSDENFVPDGRRVLVKPVIVARDSARADVRLRADLGVAEVGQVHRFRAFSNRALLYFHEISDPCSGLQVSVRPQPRTWPDAHAIIQAPLRHNPALLCGYLIAPAYAAQHAPRPARARRTNP